jgi:hypothetical protein
MPNPAPDESATAEEAPDPSVVRAERRLRLLEELSEIGMELARALKPRDEDDEIVDKTPWKDPAAAFAPLSRAIRLTLALEAKTDEALRDLKAGVVQTRVEAREHAAERDRIVGVKDRAARIERVRDLVLCVAETEVPDMDAFNKLYEALDDELEPDEDSFGYAERPFRESVERLCRGLGLNPDWDRWTDDGWILDDLPLRPGFTTFRRYGARPGADIPTGYLLVDHDLE